jgi:hypothetical protein
MLRRVVLTRATRRNISEDIILHSHHRENIKSYGSCHKLYASTNVIPRAEGMWIQQERRRDEGTAVRYFGRGNANGKGHLREREGEARV